MTKISPGMWQHSGRNICKVTGNIFQFNKESCSHQRLTSNQKILNVFLYRGEIKVCIVLAGKEIKKGQQRPD